MMEMFLPRQSSLNEKMRLVKWNEPSTESPQTSTTPYPVLIFAKHSIDSAMTVPERMTHHPTIPAPPPPTSPPTPPPSRHEQDLKVHHPLRIGCESVSIPHTLPLPLFLMLSTNLTLSGVMGVGEVWVVRKGMGGDGRVSSGLGRWGNSDEEMGLGDPF